MSRQCIFVLGLIIGALGVSIKVVETSDQSPPTPPEKWTGFVWGHIQNNPVSYYEWFDYPTKRELTFRANSNYAYTQPPGYEVSWNDTGCFVDCWNGRTPDGGGCAIAKLDIMFDAINQAKAVGSCKDYPDNWVSGTQWETSLDNGTIVFSRCFNGGTPLWAKVFVKGEEFINVNCENYQTSFENTIFDLPESCKTSQY